MFKAVVSSPRFYAFNVIVPAAGFPIGTYATGIIIPLGVYIFGFRSNIVTLTGAAGSVLNFGTLAIPAAIGSIPLASYGVNNLLLGNVIFNKTQIFMNVAGGALTAGNFNVSIRVDEIH